MKYEMRFTNYTEALAETRRYLGDEIWNKLCDLYFPKDSRFDVQSFGGRRAMRKSVYMALFFVGVRGYPQRAFLAAVVAEHRRRAVQ